MTVTKRISRLTKDKPELLSNEEAVMFATEADRMSELSKVARSPEGKTLIKLLLEDYRVKAQQLQGLYRTATRDDLVSYIASMEASWDTAKLLATSDTLLEFLDSELEDALRD